MNTFQLLAGRRSQRLTYITYPLLLAAGSAAHADSSSGSLSEVESTMTWALNIFSPTLMLTGLMLLLLFCGIMIWMGKMTGKTFTSILIGAIFAFGFRTIAPKIVAIFS